MLPAQLNSHHVHLMEPNVLPRLLAQPTLKLVAQQELESELMVFASGMQLPLHQLADQWFVEMSLVELALQFVDLVFQDAFQMEPNVLLKQLAQHTQPRHHAIQVEPTEFVSSQHQLPQVPLLEVEHAKL
jgi:hypothetical protein